MLTLFLICLVMNLRDGSGVAECPKHPGVPKFTHPLVGSRDSRLRPRRFRPAVTKWSLVRHLNRCGFFNRRRRCSKPPFGRRKDRLPTNLLRVRTWATRPSSKTKILEIFGTMKGCRIIGSGEEITALRIETKVFAPSDQRGTKPLAVGRSQT